MSRKKKEDKKPDKKQKLNTDFGHYGVANFSLRGRLKSAVPRFWGSSPSSIFKNRLVIGGLITIILILAIPVILIVYVTFAYSEKIYPGVKVAGVSISGKSQKEAKGILESRISQFMDGKLILTYQENLEASPAEVGAKFDSLKSVEEAYKIGRSGSTFSGFWVQLKGLFSSQNLPLEVSVDSEKTFNVLNNILEKINQPVFNATINLKSSEIVIEEAKIGKRMLLFESFENLILALENLQVKIPIMFEEISPQITRDDIEQNKDRIEDLISSPLVLEYLGQKWEVTSSEIILWIKISPNISKEKNLFNFWPFFFKEDSKDNRVIFDVDKKEVVAYLGKLAEKIDKPMQNARLSIQNARATVFQPSIDGRKLNQEKALDMVLEALNNDERLIDLPVEVIPADVREDNLNNLGIKELIASGTSNFAGSPANRIHNIKTGASKFNGALIKPGATFSFNEILGPVEDYTGYLPELVILNDRTVPQYGGGLCQVSTTAFRAALNAGFPITERVAHAYPVVYYYPLGVDATIYPPHPDLRFVNDSSSYILIQTYITDYTILHFDFYGTKGTKYTRFSGSKDGSGAVNRVEDTKTYTYNWGIRGSGSADAVFYRFVYDNGALVRTDEFVSNYDSPSKYPH